MSAAAKVTLIEDGKQYELRELCRLHGANINRVRARWRKLGYPEVVGLDMLTAPVQVVAWVLMWAALILTVVTGADYLRHAWNIRRDAKAAQVG